MESKVKLFAPVEYWRLKKEDPESLSMLVGGCGPGGIGDHIVPDTLWGMKVTAACAIHDFYYSEMMPGTIECKEEADRVFLNNMLRIVDARSKNKLLKRLRRRRAKTYYYCVKWWGGPAFWEHKNTEGEYQEV